MDSIYCMKIKLPRPPEPQSLREEWKKKLQNDRKLTLASIKQGTWFTKPYWDTYKEVLKAQGIAWQNLMEAYGLCQYKFIEWVEGKESWNNVISFLEEQLNAIVRVKKKG